MRDGITQRLIAVANVLNTISVSGKQNLANLSGSIGVIEEVLGMLENADVIPKNTGEAEGV